MQLLRSLLRPTRNLAQDFERFGQHSFPNRNTIQVGMLRNSGPPSLRFTNDFVSQLRQSGIKTIDAGHVANPRMMAALNSPAIQSRLEGLRVVGRRSYALDQENRAWGDRVLQADEKPFDVTMRPGMPKIASMNNFEKYSMVKRALIADTMGNWAQNAVGDNLGRWGGVAANVGTSIGASMIPGVMSVDAAHDIGRNAVEGYGHLNSMTGQLMGGEFGNAMRSGGKALWTGAKALGNGLTFAAGLTGVGGGVAKGVQLGFKALGGIGRAGAGIGTAASGIGRAGGMIGKYTPTMAKWTGRATGLAGKASGGVGNLANRVGNRVAGEGSLLAKAEQNAAQRIGGTQVGQWAQKNPMTAGVAGMAPGAAEAAPAIYDALKGPSQAMQDWGGMQRAVESATSSSAMDPRFINPAQSANFGTAMNQVSGNLGIPGGIPGMLSSALPRMIPGMMGG